MNNASPEQLEQRFSPEAASKHRFAIIEDGLSQIEKLVFAMGLDEVNIVSQTKNKLIEKKSRDINKSIDALPELSKGQDLPAKVGKPGGAQGGKENPLSNDADNNENENMENIRADVNAAYEK